jgi:UDP-N-acetylmuramoyl-tripeptide--D-alanyl-D-alanine ligase
MGKSLARIIFTPIGTMVYLYHVIKLSNYHNQHYLRIMQIEQLYSLYLQHQSITTDTRKINTGDIFFALKGDNFNGNTFAAKAIEQGAAYAVVDEVAFATHPNIILVADVLTTLQLLAKHHRTQFNIPFIAITGSNGKTTSKELVHAVLSTTYKCYTTEGNLNNHIGIPLTILKIKQDAEIAIIEMGANHQKEIESYCLYTLPTWGIITNCGKAHLEGFGGADGVKKGKGELFDYIRSTNGGVFIMNDYNYLQTMSQKIKTIVTYGTSNADIVGNIVHSEPFLEVAFPAYNSSIKTQLVGDYNLPNILLAAAVGWQFKVPFEKIKQSIEAYTPSNSRSQMLVLGSNKIILDAYNANPSSMKLAIENIAKLDVPNKVLILGAMAELGIESIAEHQAIAELIANYQWKAVALVGGDFLKIKHSFTSLENSTTAATWYKNKCFTDCYILIKGSRSSKMELVLA